MVLLVRERRNRYALFYNYANRKWLNLSLRTCANLWHNFSNNKIPYFAFHLHYVWSIHWWTSTFPATTYNFLSANAAVSNEIFDFYFVRLFVCGERERIYVSCGKLLPWKMFRSFDVVLLPNRKPHNSNNCCKRHTIAFPFI